MARKWIGRRFVTRTKHPQEAGRTIQIIGRADGVAGMSFRVRNIAHPGNPAAVGRESTISAVTLEKAWTPVDADTGPDSATGPGSPAGRLRTLRARVDASPDDVDLAWLWSIANQHLRFVADVKASVDGLDTDAEHGSPEPWADILLRRLDAALARLQY